MLVACLTSTALKFKPSSAGSPALVARLKGTSGLSITVMHVERNGVYLPASLEGQMSAALC